MTTSQKKPILRQLVMMGLPITTSLFALNLHSPNVAFARDPVDVVCASRVTIIDALKIPYCSNKTLGQTDSTVKRAVVVVHGTSRNADDYYEYVKNAATSGGVIGETLIIAPQFLLEEDLTARNPGNDVLFWTNDGWKQGDKSESTSSFPRSNRVSSFIAVEQILKQLANRSLYPNLSSVVITGHSAGGQFTNRFSAASQIEQQTLTPMNLKTRYVVANPSSYVYLDDKRRVAGTLDSFALPTQQEIANCPNYNDYKYGLNKINSYLQAVGVTQIRSQFSPRDVVYLLGEADTDPNDDGLDTDCPAMLQGNQRLERGTIYYNYLLQYYISQGLKHTKVTVPGIGHSGSGMYNSPQGIQALFGTPAPNPNPVPGATTTIKVNDGWDQKNGKTLKEDQKVYLLQNSDNDRVDLESSYFWSFQVDNIPTNVTVKSVKVYVEHYEEEEIQSNAVVLEVGGGALRTPTTFASKQLPVLAGENKEQTVEWDVTSIIKTPAQVNDLNVIVRNQGSNGKKIKLDRVYVVVTY
jgi:hypothetical protein